MNIKDRIWCLGAFGSFSCISCVLTPFPFPKAAKWDIMPPNGSDGSQTLTSTDGQVRRNPHPSRGRLLDLPGEVLRLICAQLCHHCRSHAFRGLSELSMNTHAEWTSYCKDNLALNALSQTCTIFRDVAQPLLYHFLRIKRHHCFLRTVREHPDLADHVKHIWPVGWAGFARHLEGCKTHYFCKGKDRVYSLYQLCVVQIGCDLCTYCSCCSQCFACCCIHSGKPCYDRLFQIRCHDSGRHYAVVALPSRRPAPRTRLSHSRRCLRCPGCRA